MLLGSVGRDIGDATGGFHRAQGSGGDSCGAGQSLSTLGRSCHHSAKEDTLPDTEDFLWDRLPASALLARRDLISLIVSLMQVLGLSLAVAASVWAAEGNPKQEKPIAKMTFDTHSGYYPFSEFEPNATESFVVFNDQKEFDKVFGMVLYENAHRLPRNAFTSNFVVATIKRATAVWEYKVESVTEANGIVEIRYAATSKKNDVARRAYSLIASIPKGKVRAVQFVENERLVKRVEIKQD